MVDETKVIRYVREFAEKIMIQKVDDNYCYHNLEHIKEVVKAAEEIGKACNLDEIEMEIVIIAAWLHDIGYEKGYDDHEELGIQSTRELLMDFGYEHDNIQKVLGCIAATKMPQRPDNILEKVICDADLYHLSTDKFEKRSELLRQELCSTDDNNITYSEWLSRTFSFMKKHRYFTKYGQTVLEKRKQKNLEILTKKL